MQNLSDQLKKITRENHQQLEKLLIPGLRKVTTKEDYVEILQLFYSYFGALEEKIDVFIGSDDLPDYNQRRKTNSIANDIANMGGMLPAKAQRIDLPEIKDQWQALGALYVIEGSTLGGKVISQMITKQLKINVTDGISFFKSYGDNTESMWASFKEHLNNFTSHGSISEEIISSANETFLKFKNWIEKNHKNLPVVD